MAIIITGVSLPTLRLVILEKLNPGGAVVYTAPVKFRERTSAADEREDQGDGIDEN